ncbi:MAG: Wadjet anti-phage system protein JetA family protein [Symbiobacteriia bacterium]
MRLFDVIPDRFFSVLASRGKAVYADALFLLYDLYRKNLFGIPREAVVDVLTDLMVEREEAGETEDDWLAEEPEPVADRPAPPPVPVQPSLPTDPRAKASMILRRLKDAGWVDIEIRINYDEYVNLMDYAIQVLDVLDRIRTRRQAEYRGFVFQTYLALQSEDAQRDGHLALQAAYDQTESLVRELKSLNHNIRRYSERLLQQKRPQDILAMHFLEYQGEILNRSYHQLKTSDHVSRYRPRILQAVGAWLRDPARVSAAAEGLRVAGQATDPHEAQAEVLRRLTFIEASYSSMDDLLYEIDRRNAQYAKRSLEQVRYMLNSSKDTKGYLVDLLKFMGEQVAAGVWERREEMPAEWQELFTLAATESLEDRSLFAPRRAREIMQPLPLAREPVDAAAQARAFRRLRERLANRLTVERVNDYVLAKLGQGVSARASELGVETADDFLMLIHIAAFAANRRASYDIDFTGPRVESAAGRFRFRDVTIRRKEHA